MTPLYSPRLDQALALAADAFRTTTRKGTQVPYLSHLLQVMVLVTEHGGSEDQQIAALLHDYLEDIPGADVGELRQRFGDVVADYVLALSDSTGHPKPAWEERKRRYLSRLLEEPAEVKLIAAADKLHNAMSLTRDLDTVGPDVWSRFNVDRARSLWYYRAVSTALAHGWTHPLLERLLQEIDLLHARSDVPCTPVTLAELGLPR